MNQLDLFADSPREYNSAMDACIALWTKRAPGFSGLPGAVGGIAMRTLALRALDEMKNKDLKPVDVVGTNLPWNLPAPPYRFSGDRLQRLVRIGVERGVISLTRADRDPAA